jgi:RNA polymerase sigma factor (sigma-70 family)
MPGSQASTILHYLRYLMASRPAEGLSDRQLLDCFKRQRDEAAFSALVQRYGPMVLGVCRRILQNPEDAEDAFQATFLVLARKAGSVRWQESAGNWIYGVASRVARKARARAVRHRARETVVTIPACRDELTLMGEPTSHESDPAEAAARRDLFRVVDEELSRLPAKLRQAIVLCYLQGKSNTEAARDLCQPSGSMSRHLARARERLRKRLTDRGVVLSGAAFLAILENQSLCLTVPKPLGQATAQAALDFASGSAAAGALSTQSIALAEGVLKSMFLAKVKLVAVILLSTGLLGLGVGGVGPGLARQGKKPVNPQKPAAGSTTEQPKAQDPNNIVPSGAGAAAASPAPDPKPHTAGAAETRAALGKLVDLPVGFEPNTPLREATEFLGDRYKVQIIFDDPAFKRDLSIDNMSEQPVKLPKLSGLTLSQVLQLLATQVNATYLVRPNHILITTHMRSNPKAWQRSRFVGAQEIAPPVTISFQNDPIDQALGKLSDLTGINIVLDYRCIEKAANGVVTTNLTNVPLDTAVKLLADMVELDAVALDSALYVTSPDNASNLRQRQQEEKEPQSAPATPPHVPAAAPQPKKQ